MSTMARKQKPHVTSEPPIDLAENLGVFRLMADGWSTLILREIFFGTNRFGELQRALSIAPGMLTNRLAGLVDEGVVGRRQYRPDKPWYEYELTEKGQKFAPAWIMMARLADVKYGAPEVKNATSSILSAARTPTRFFAVLHACRPSHPAL